MHDQRANTSVIENALDYVIDVTGCADHPDAALSVSAWIGAMRTMLEPSERLHVIGDGGISLAGLSDVSTQTASFAQRSAFLAEVRADLVHRFSSGERHCRGIPNLFTPIDISDIAKSSGRIFGFSFVKTHRCRRNLRRAAHIFVPSIASFETLSAFVGANSLSRCSVLSPPAPKVFVPGFDEAISDLRSRHDLPERFFLAVDRGGEGNNLETLLEAYDMLDETASLPLIVAGRESQRVRIPQKVRYVEIESAAELAGLISASSVFLYPEHGGDFPYPLLWAMACGAPTVAAATHQVREIASGEVKLVHPTDRVEWRRALTSAVVSMEWRDPAKQAGLKKAAEFNAETSARRTLEIYRKITRKTGVS